MRAVIKVGTNLLTGNDGSLDEGRISRIVKEIAALKNKKHSVVLVTSGAIGAGMGRLKLKTRPSQLKEKQALAAIGQPILMNAYQEHFNKQGIMIAQVLLTRHDFDDRQRYLNARNTLLSLLEMGVVPIINENDTIAVEEINFGDNDTLAALVAAKISAEVLVLLTDVDGLYDGEPGSSNLVPVVEKITKEVEGYATKKSGSGKGVGGMQTKIIAARIATAAGVKTVIANGSYAGIIEKVVSGERVGTEFLPQKPLEARKCWIAFGSKCKGRIVVDDGAVMALRDKNKSLLPSGVVAVEGSFKVGDTISIFDNKGKEVARGLSYYSSQDVVKMKGKKTAEIKSMLGVADYDEVVHKDNLVVL